MKSTDMGEMHKTTMITQALIRAMLDDLGSMSRPAGIAHGMPFASAHGVRDAMDQCPAD
jgi:hypothetical protein